MAFAGISLAPRFSYFQLNGIFQDLTWPAHFCHAATYWAKAWGLEKPFLAGDKWLSHGRRHLEPWAAWLGIPLLAGETGSSLQAEVKV